jgi:hypothetical protein
MSAQRAQRKWEAKRAVNARDAEAAGSYRAANSHGKSGCLYPGAGTDASRVTVEKLVFVDASAAA